ncbi:hypothetical protein B0H10DRAFT_1729442, partial [Mycena sp. CBHHK59/15]
ITDVNFSHTCSGIGFSGTILKASCNDWGGSSKTTSIDTNSCVGNNNGILIAGTNYASTCGEITFAVTTVNATCINRNKVPVPASLDLGS